MPIRLIEWNIPFYSVTLAGGGASTSTRPITMKANLINNVTNNRLHMFIREHWLKYKSTLGRDLLLLTDDGTQSEAFWEGSFPIPPIDNLGIEISAINTAKDTTTSTFDRDITTEFYPLPLGTIVKSIHGWIDHNNDGVNLFTNFKGSIIYEEPRTSRLRF